MIVCETTTYAKAVPDGDIRKQHIAFLRKYGDQGKILMAGRLADSKGAMILWDVGSFEEAEQLTQEDPYAEQDQINLVLREWPLTLNYTVYPPDTS